MCSPRNKHLSARRCWSLQDSRGSCLCPSSWGAGCPRRRCAEHGMLVPSVHWLWLDESSHRLHCKIMRGQLLGCSWDKQLPLQLPKAFTAKPVPGAAPFAVLSSTSYAGEELVAGTVATWGLSVDFPHLHSTCPIPAAQRPMRLLPHAY